MSDQRKWLFYITFRPGSNHYCRGRYCPGYNKARVESDQHQSPVDKVEPHRSYRHDQNTSYRDCLRLGHQSAHSTEYFYKITSTETLSGTTSGTQSTSEDIQSVFAGVLLDITPEISDDNTITLKINPSLSETASSTFVADSAEDRTMPPDLRRRQLSSVVTVKDGNRVILGGLINTSNTVNMNKVPILGDIPILNYLFKYEDRQKITQELVIVIQPRIIAKDKKDLSLADLGYQGLSEKILLNAKDAITTTEDIAKEEN